MRKTKEFIKNLIKDAPGVFQLSVVNPTTHSISNKFLDAPSFRERALTWTLIKGHIFFSPNPRIRPSGKDCDVKTFTSFFIDFDSGDKRKLWQKIKKFPFFPTAIVSSGRGYHVYWFFKEPEEIPAEFFRGVQKGLAEFFESDPTIFNPARLMRLPGSINPKNGRKAEVRLLTNNEYNPQDFEVFYRKTTPSVKLKLPERLNLRPVKKSEILKLSVSQKTKNRILKGTLEGAPSRSERDIRIVRALLKAGMKPEKIAALFLNPNFGCSDKVREKGRDGIRYLLFTLEKAKKYKEVKR